VLHTEPFDTGLTVSVNLVVMRLSMRVNYVVLIDSVGRDQLLPF
jgi:hypothetical protein